MWERIQSCFGLKQAQEEMYVYSKFFKNSDLLFCSISAGQAQNMEISKTMHDGIDEHSSHYRFNHDDLHGMDPSSSLGSLSKLLMCSTPEPAKPTDTTDASSQTELCTANWCNNVDQQINGLLTDVYILNENNNEMEEKILEIDTKINTVTNKASSCNVMFTPTPGSDHQETVTCHNRFAVFDDDSNDGLMDEDTDTQNNKEQQWTVKSNKKRHRRYNKNGSKKQHPKDHDKTRVTIIGSSMVWDLGGLVTSDDITACSFTNPGCTSDQVKDSKCPVLTMRLLSLHVQRTMYRRMTQRLSPIKYVTSRRIQDGCDHLHIS